MNPKELISFTVFKSKTDTIPEHRILPWAQLINWLTVHEERSEKDGRLFSPTIYRKNGRRGLKGVATLSMLVMEYDDGTSPEALTPAWERFEYLVYSTFSHTPDKPKWRVAFPLTAPVAAEEWPRVYRNLTTALGQGHTDRSCKDCSRIYYLPSCPPDAERFAFHHVGAGLDPDTFPDVEPTEKAAATQKVAANGVGRVLAPVRAENGQVSGETLLGAALNRTGEGRNVAGFWLACQLRDNRYSPDEAQAWMMAYSDRVPAGDEPYTLDEALHSLDQAYQQPAREPWAPPGRSFPTSAALRPTSNGAKPGEISSSGGAAAGPEPAEDSISFADFWAYMPEHRYIFAPTGDLWPATSVNRRLPRVPTGETDDEGKPKTIPAAEWLDQNQPVEQMTWAPGESQIIGGRLVADGGWIERPGCSVFNLYRPPVVGPGNAGDIQPWWDHIVRIYGAESAEHIVLWLAHRVQRPGEKLNHALVLGGAQGIGKDTLLEPVKAAVGPWNFADVTPMQILGRFNSFVKSVILRVSEARDLGDVDRYALYEHMKQYTAAPPDVLRCDEKNRQEYQVRNVCGVIITTNHRLNGLYLPDDDRRHYVAWSECGKEEFTGDYWRDLWAWYACGGYANVASYLRTVDLSGFDPKEPPPKTEAWYAMVGTDRAPEDDELADALAALHYPDVVSKEMLLNHDLVSPDLKEWLREKKNARSIPHRLEKAGYINVRNSGQKDGRWKVSGKNVALYGKKGAIERDRQAAAAEFVGRGW